MRKAAVADGAGLALLVVLGALLRGYRLGRESLWLDELLSLEGARTESLGSVFAWAAAHASPPGYEAFLHLWVAAFGDAEWVLRLPSALAGVLAIVAIQRLGESLWSRREGLVAALLLAVSWQPIAYSQEARPYSLLILFSILSFQLWLEMVARVRAGRPLGPLRQLAYVGCAAALLSLHFYGSLVVAVQGLGVAIGLAQRPRAWWPLAAPWLLGALCFLPALPVVWDAIGWSDFWLAEPSLHTLRLAWRLYFFKPGDLHRSVPWVLLAAAALTVWERRREGGALVASPWDPIPLLLAWLVLPALFAFAWSKWLLPILAPRHLLVSLPAAYLLLARATTVLLRAPRAQAVAAVALGLLLLARLLGPGGYYEEPRKAQRLALSRWVAEHESQAPAAELVAFGGPASGFDHYLARAGARGRVGLMAGYAGDVDEVARFVADSQAPAFWYLAADLEPTPGFLDALGARFDLVREQRWHRAAARLYCVRGGECPVRASGDQPVGPTSRGMAATMLAFGGPRKSATR